MPYLRRKFNKSPGEWPDFGRDGQLKTADYTDLKDNLGFTRVKISVESDLSVVRKVFTGSGLVEEKWLYQKLVYRDHPSDICDLSITFDTAHL